MKRTSRKPFKISDSLQRHLNAYALAASAAAVGMLASTQPAEAEIIYTHANRVVPPCRPHQQPCFRLDLNHDNIADFRMVWFANSAKSGQGSNGSSFLAMRPAKYKPKNEIWGTISTSWDKRQFPVAAALSSGVSIGPNSVKFQPGNSGMMGWDDVGGSCSCGGGWGKWGGARDKYLGLKFLIKGNVHYGWARLSTSSQEVKLTGYAYETIPNKAIITGKTQGPDVITLEPGSLGALAAGASRLHGQK
jgi:hypothetical protein